MAMRSAPAPTEPKTSSVILPASAEAVQSLTGIDLLRSRTPSVTDLSDTCSFVSAASLVLDDALPEVQDSGKSLQHLPQHGVLQ